jgi:hypothetical protein
MVSRVGTRGVVIATALVIFVATFWFGAAINRAVSGDSPSRPTRVVPAAVEPGTLPAISVLLPGIKRPQKEAQLRPGLPETYVIGKVSPVADKAFAGLGLPFAIRQFGPQDWYAYKLENSTYALYRRVRGGQPPNITVDVLIAAHPCTSLDSCRAERAQFDTRWTKRFKAARPTIRHDGQTWYTVTRKTTYSLAMTRIFRSESTDSWWLVGVDAGTTKTYMIEPVQAIVNDIYFQTS